MKMPFLSSFPFLAAGLLAAACSSTNDSSSSTTDDTKHKGAPLLGQYVADAAGLFTEITFLDDNKYSAHLWDCPTTGANECAQRGTYAVNGNKLTLTPDGGDAISLRLRVDGVASGDAPPAPADEPAACTCASLFAAQGATNVHLGGADDDNGYDNGTSSSQPFTSRCVPLTDDQCTSVLQAPLRSFTPGQLSISTEGNFAPFTSSTGTPPVWSGINVDYDSSIAAELGNPTISYTQEALGSGCCKTGLPKSAMESQLWFDLESKTSSDGQHAIDFADGAFAVNQQRAQIFRMGNYLFAQENDLAFVASASAPDATLATDGTGLPGVKVGVVKGTTYEAYLGLCCTQAKEVNAKADGTAFTQNDLLGALIAGDVDAIEVNLLDPTITTGLNANPPTLKLIPGPTGQTKVAEFDPTGFLKIFGAGVGIIFNMEADPVFVNQVNCAIGHVVNGQAFTDLQAKYPANGTSGALIKPGVPGGATTIVDPYSFYGIEAPTKALPVTARPPCAATCEARPSCR